MLTPEQIKANEKYRKKLLKLKVRIEKEKPVGMGETKWMTAKLWVRQKLNEENPIGFR